MFLNDVNGVVFGGLRSGFLLWQSLVDSSAMFLLEKFGIF